MYHSYSCLTQNTASQPTKTAHLTCTDTTLLGHTCIQCNRNSQSLGLQVIYQSVPNINENHYYNLDLYSSVSQTFISENSSLQKWGGGEGGTNKDAVGKRQPLHQYSQLPDKNYSNISTDFLHFSYFKFLTKPWLRHTALDTQIKLKNVYRFSSQRAVNTLRLSYKNQPVNAV
jgi:hypothetical protein